MDNPTGTTFADDAAMFQETGSIPPTIFQNLINEYVDNVVRKRRRTDVMEIGDLQDNGPRHMQDEMIKLRDEITEMRGEITEMRNEMSKMKDELRGEQSRRPTQQDFEDAGPPSASQASRIKIGPASEPESIQRSPGWAPSPPSPSTLTSEGADAILAQLEVNIVLMKDDGEVSSEDLPPAVKISAARTLSEAQRRFPSASWKSSIKCATCAGKMPMSSIHRVSATSDAILFLLVPDLTSNRKRSRR